tara:strand:- start:1463 stop:3247 length:1785 start_codon:yes stop_codon:yes gene_type:complete
MVKRLVKRAFRPVRKIAKKIIPKEVRPFLPYIAAGFGPSTAGLSFGSGLGTALGKRALIAAATSAATDEQGDPLRAGLLAIAPNVAAEGLGAVASKFPMAGVDDPSATFSFAEKIGEGARRGADFIERQGAVKTIGAQTAIDQSAKFAEIRQDEIDKYNEELRKQGVLDKTKRRTSILNIYLNAGYEPDYVNSMLDRYGYDKGGLAMFKNMTPRMQGFKAPKSATSLFRKKPDDIEYTALLEGIEIDDDNDDDDKDNKKRRKGKKDEPVEVSVVKEEPDFVEAMLAAKSGVEQAFGIPFSGVAPAEFKRFARGGEVEIEEETEDLGIRDFMRDQGVEYGDQVSNTQNDRILEMLFEKYLEMGLSPKDAAEAAQNEFDRMSRKSDEGIMQMASGYKTDIEEMYEQYVFEMEEQGLQPMSFREFMDQARSGMADGGEVSIGKIEMLIKRGADNDLIKEYTGAADGVIDQIRDAMERKKTNMADGGIMSPEEYFEGKRKYQNKKGKERMRREYEEYRDRMKYGPRDEAKDGGIMEKDMRGGGFIPEGTKERADDVPARLSKNEFVMTADAVRAAGGGSVNKGAKRMYDMMYSLEGKV